MALLVDQLNVVNCSVSGVIGTGLAGCKIDRKRVVALGLLQKGYVFPAGGINKALMLSLLQAGTLIYLKGVVTFAESTPEDSVKTFDGSGLKSVINKFPYEYKATFNNGVNFNKALNTLSGNGNYDIVMWDVDDVMWLTQNKAGDVKGFGLGMHEAGNYKGNDGTDVASQTLMLQLTDRSEVDDRMVNVLPDDFGSTDIDGVNEVKISINATAPGTSVVFKAMLSDNSHLLLATTVSNWIVKKNGAPITPSAISYVTNPDYITFTVAALIATDVVTVQLNGTINQLGTLYKSNVATVTVA